MTKNKVAKNTVGFFLVFTLFFISGCAGQKSLTVEESTLSESKEVVELPEKASVPDEKKPTITPSELLLREIKKQKEEQKAGESVPYLKDKEKPAETVQAVNADEILASKKPTGDETARSLPQTKKAAKRKTVSKAGDIVLNFDRADLNEVIRTMAALLKINYIIGQDIQGKVTINTAGMLRKEDLFPVFFQILEANGLTAVKEGNLYRILKIKQASRMSITPRFGREDQEAASGESIIMQIIPLKNIAAAEFTKLLTPFISAEGTIISHKDSNTLLLVDKSINIMKVLKLADVFDVGIFQNVNHRFYPLENIDAGEMVKLLNDILSVYSTFTKANLKIIGISRLNTILVVSRNSEHFGKIEGFIRQLDIPGQDLSGPNIYVYSVKNGEAADLAAILGSVLTAQDDSGKISAAGYAKGKERKSDIQENPLTRKTEKEKKISVTKGKAVKFVSGTLKGKISITPDEIRNALIIRAVPSDYRAICSILNRIDILPRQVLIEVKIAEITLDESTKLGVEWSYVRGDGSSLTSHLLEAEVGGSGLKFTVGMIDRWSSILEALATENKVNILSSPSVLASDNKEAKIDISTEIPVASTQYEYTSDNPVLETTIEYRNTGVILSVTPHINERGLVSMDINQEVSEQSKNVMVGDKEYPSFFKRTVTTSLTVKDGQTIAIGGLIRETKSDGTSGVPLLSRLPIIGFIFGKDSTSISKNELIILITPHVINSLEDIDAVTQEFKNKTGNLMRAYENSTFQN